MTAQEFQKRTTGDESDFLSRFLALLNELGSRFCVISGQGVNAYVEPLVSLDLDVVVAAGQLPELEKQAERESKLQRFPHSLNLSAPGSDLRVQNQLDNRYQAFLDRSAQQMVLGTLMPVASVDDVLRGKIWAYQDDTQRGSKRQKDLADIARLLEAHPHLGPTVPEAIRQKLT
jgi:hypothetical protein